MPDPPKNMEPILRYFGILGFGARRVGDWGRVQRLALYVDLLAERIPITTADELEAWHMAMDDYLAWLVSQPHPLDPAWTSSLLEPTSDEDP